MLPDPLHPAIVHFPIVLALLAPLVAGGVWYAIRRELIPARAWLAVLLLLGVVVLAGWVTMETGENEEERVEEVVAHKVIHEHEEAAERFLILAGIAFALGLGGLVSRPYGEVAKGAALVSSVAAALAVAAVGHSGGELVYRHGAASAYTMEAGGPVAQHAIAGDHEEEEDDD